MSFPLFVYVVPLNDKKTLEMRALSFDRDDDLGEPGLEDVLKAKKPKDVRKGNLLSTFYLIYYLNFFFTPSFYLRSHLVVITFPIIDDY